MGEATKTHADAFQEFHDEPEAFRDALDFVTNGGTLPDYCIVKGIRFSDMIEWIRLDAYRSKRYTQALSDRAEWSKETVFAQIKSLALSSELEMKPMVKLRALELLGKALGMFVERREHEHRVTLEDLIDQSMRLSQGSSH